MKAILIARIGVELATVKGALLIFSKVIGLHLGVVYTKPFPINLVQIVGLQDRTADNASARGGFDDKVNMAKHDVEFRDKGGCIALLGYG